MARCAGIRWRALASGFGGLVLASLLLLLAPGPAEALTPAACPPPVVPAAAEVPPRDRGLLWRLQRDGRTAYLYGTLHLGRPAWSAPGPQVAAALRDSDVLALELDLADPAVQREMMASAVGQPQAMPLTPLQQATLQRLTAAACLPPTALAALHPLMQAMTLALLDARWEGLDAAFGQDMMLAAVMRASGRPVLSLETVATQVTVLIPADRQRAATALDQLLQQLEDRRSRAPMRRLADAWQNGRLDELETYPQWCDCIDSDADRDFMQQLNDARNPALAAAIAAWHGRGRRVFAAVGALHMTGPNALPGLLQRLGFSVERVVFAR